MRYIVIADHPTLLDLFKKFPAASDPCLFLEANGKAYRIIESRRWRRKSLGPAKTLAGLASIRKGDRVLVHCGNREILSRVLRELEKRREDFEALVILNAGDEALPLQDSRISRLAAGEVLGRELERKWDFMSTHREVRRLQALLQPAKNVFILMQHDPDPDALASALALRALLNRNKSTAPIGTFGEITWRENLAMRDLLDIDITQVDSKSIQGYERIAVVDAQPPYFQDLLRRVDAVIDHHPNVAPLGEIPFVRIKTSFGATSSIFTEYLFASGITPNRRLATALLYGIITDTLFLGREAGTHDFEAFKSLWPLANHTLLRKMSRPQLGEKEMGIFIRALKKREVRGRVLYAFLGEVDKEDIIPRLADFCLSVEAIDWSVICGICSGNIVISVRNMGIPRSSGLLANKLFGAIGRAGGHHTMAKAVIPLKEFREKFRTASPAEVSGRVRDILMREIGEKDTEGEGG